jgi:hypothetical protein
MLVDQGEYHILELRFRDGCPSNGQETGMRKTENLIKNNLFISDCFFGVLNIESVQVFEEFLDNGDVVGIHDNVHHDDYYFFVELSFSRVATKGETIFEHAHQLLHVFFGVVGYRVRVFFQNVSDVGQRSQGSVFDKFIFAFGHIQEVHENLLDFSVI